ncbi:MAG: acyclic terpene utilization AtuA family protein, partial [Thermodesulfobacteriota bacterium]|nr:acyclic terpene utilization AtuA family protein [Thermodesulfobacteriota bacterium]
MSNKVQQGGGKVIIGNCSGYFGDRLAAAREMVQGGPIDILTGDYLAELTMALLFRQRLKNPDRGYVPTFLRQMEEIMGECLDKNIRVVSNAGGLNPRGLAEELEKIAENLGLHPKIACIEGDDLMERLGDLQEQGEAFTHLDKGISLKEANAQPITANAYLGGWGIAEALRQGADIVVGGRIADASVVVGPAAWWFDWKHNDWDRLAGTVVAGHIVECGAQATGGNYSFIDEIPSFINVGYPIAEIYEDGSSVITKHPGTGGLVSLGTVKAQLLYEIREPKYLTPDVAARFDTIDISQEGPDRVRVTGVKGEPPPETTKVCINNLSGYRNSMTIVLTGLDIEKKAKIFEDALFDSIGGRGQYAVEDVQLVRSEKEDPDTNDEAFAYLRVSVMDPDAKKVGRFSAKIVELGLANIPGFTATAPPTKGTPAIQHWPAIISGK